MSLTAEAPSLTAHIEPASVLPEQFHATPRLGGEGERRLILALIEEAIHTWQSNAFAEAPKGKREFHEAEEWFAGTGEAMIPFEDACAVLSIDAQWLRARLQRWRAAEAARPQPANPPKIYRSRARTVRLVSRPAVNE